jgi:hypothetical protein
MVGFDLASATTIMFWSRQYALTVDDGAISLFDVFKCLKVKSF